MSRRDLTIRQMMQVGIVGYGVIGRALERLLRRSETHRVHIYDKYVEAFSSPQHFVAVDRCEIVFIAVPTPYDTERQACDVSIVSEIVRAISAPMCIKSTVPPGTTDRLEHSCPPAAPTSRQLKTVSPRTPPA